MKRIYALLMMVVFPVLGFALEPEELKRVLTEIGNKNYASAERLLHDPSEALRRDPDYYVVLLNYALAKANTLEVMLEKGRGKPGDFALKEKKSGKEAGYLGFRENYDEKMILDSVARTQAALPGFKSRLDIRFGIVTVLEKIEKWDLLSEQLLDTLKTSKELDNKWTWGPIGSIDGTPKEFMLKNVLMRTSRLFHLDTPATDQEFLKISNALVQYYPDTVYGYTNLGIFEFAKGNLPEAEADLNKALAIDPHDQVVLANLERVKEAKGARASQDASRH